MNLSNDKLDEMIEAANSGMENGSVQSEVSTAILAEVLAELRLHRRGEDMQVRIAQAGLRQYAAPLARDILESRDGRISQDMKDAALYCITEANRLDNEFYSQLCNSPYDFNSKQSLVDFSEMIDELLEWEAESKS